LREKKPKEDKKNKYQLKKLWQNSKHETIIGGEIKKIFII
jgi:hypothetical protein